MRFFHQLATLQELQRWTDILDILLDNSHFPENKGWDKNKIGCFTKKVKRLDGISKNWIVKAKKDMRWSGANLPTIHVIMINGNSEGRLLLRHMRNSIAHGHCEISTIKGEQIIELKDYSTNTCEEQTADIRIPLQLLYKIFQTYDECQKPKDRTNKRTARAKKRAA